MSEVLHRECRVFTRYLIQAEATECIAARYAAAHAVREEVQTPGRFDRMLVTAASRHPWATRLADSYSALLRPHGTLRQKLVLLLALLESTAPTAAAIDAADGPAKTIVSGAVRGVLFPVWLLAGVIVFTPLRIVAALRGG